MAPNLSVALPRVATPVKPKPERAAKKPEQVRQREAKTPEAANRPEFPRGGAGGGRAECTEILSQDVDTLAERILDIQLAISNEPQVIGLIMKTVHSEPHYCKAYADLVYKLKAELSPRQARRGTVASIHAALFQQFCLSAAFEVCS